MGARSLHLSGTESMMYKDIVPSVDYENVVRSRVDHKNAALSEVRIQALEHMLKITGLMRPFMGTFASFDAHKECKWIWLIICSVVCKQTEWMALFSNLRQPCGHKSER